ncbi:AraC family transcriptional regulator [Methylobacterium oxalidis]|uniref:AraC family transcriptional regulator n=1 Tax=Methylobacterium oxalidis TaxID=944322 RepID=A0A512JAM0_9HYPH|nr:helix-turn-helix transcriptional regulator [Methylobacterium oxalidis]GEP06919.1 AraC family transcriptional regulator [Methylobacterium oxalidis]GJE33112.1 HTH-type transcriptional regulator NimR [Methylobacterium oxalidis]GLS64408.1 AraC family transcriptional regulator [Methylobacterium oxalidis]
MWEPIAVPPGLVPPRPITVRAQTIPARGYFAEHAHRWHQIVYATSGVLTVAVEGRSFVISPEQAVWLPTGVRHRVGSLLGAQFRSLWVADEAGRDVAEHPTVFAVQPLLRALILEAVAIAGRESDDGYSGRVATLILDQFRRARPLPGALPWPREGPLVGLCEALYADPADARGPEEWGRELGLSARTLARRFETDMGMSLRSWRRRLRLFRVVELMGGGLSVTETAMQLGYGSTSAFVYAFRTELGSSPQAYIQEQVSGRPRQ